MYACTNCPKLLTSYQRLEDHIFSVHLQIQPYRCEFCDQSFSGFLGFKDHRARVHFCLTDPPLQCYIQFTCPHCSTNFSGLQDLKSHKVQQHRASDSVRGKSGSSATLHKCRICYLVLYSKRAFTSHMERHYGAKPFACILCSKLFTSDASRARHIASVHDKCEIVKCTACLSLFRSQTELEAHVASDHSLPAFKCSVCNDSVSFQSFNEVSYHFRLKHALFDVPHACLRCSLCFLSRHERVEHMCIVSSTANQSPIITCPFHCGAVLRCQDDWDTHVDSHTDEKAAMPRLNCYFCRKSFLTEKQLHAHASRCKHNNQVDAQAAKPTSNMVLHICSTCGRGFSHKYNLKRHQQSLHGN